MAKIAKNKVSMASRIRDEILADPSTKNVDIAKQLKCNGSAVSLERTKLKKSGKIPGKKTPAAPKIKTKAASNASNASSASDQITAAANLINLAGSTSAANDLIAAIAAIKED